MDAEAPPRPVRQLLPPAESIRRLRPDRRRRETLVADANRTIRHMQTALTEVNVKLTNFISDLSGETGLRIIEAILAGERDSQTLARFKDRRLRARVAKPARALAGHWDNVLQFEVADFHAKAYQEGFVNLERQWTFQCAKRVWERQPARDGGSPSFPFGS